MPGSSSASGCLQAVPARSPPAYGFFLVRSCHGGTSPKKHINLQPIMLLSRYNVCKKSRAFKNANKTVFESGSYTYNILKRVFGNLFFKFCLENFLHQYEPIGPFWNTVLKTSQFWTKRKTAKQIKSTLPFCVDGAICINYCLGLF